MEILVNLLIAFIAFGIVYWLITSVFPMPNPVRMGALCVLGFIALLYLLGLLGMIPAWQPLRLR